MLFKWMPVSGRTIPLPRPFDTVKEAHIPFASTVLMCVVPVVQTGPETCDFSQAVVSVRASAIATGCG